MKAFILSQFNYCPLVWMFCDRTLNNKINRIHERALRITYKDITSDYDTMLLRDNAVPIHIRNLQLLMTEVYKTKWELNPSFMKEIFVEKRSPYGLRSCHDLLLPKVRITCHCTYGIVFWLTQLPGTFKMRVASSVEITSNFHLLLLEHRVGKSLETQRLKEESLQFLVKARHFS